MLKAGIEEGYFVITNFWRKVLHKYQIYIVGLNLTVLEQTFLACKGKKLHNNFHSLAHSFQYKK